MVTSGVAERAQTWGWGALLNFHLQCSLGGASRHLACRCIWGSQYNEKLSTSGRSLGGGGLVRQWSKIFWGWAKTYLGPPSQILAIGSAEDLPPRFRPNPRGNARTPPGSARIRRTSAKNIFRRTPPNVRRTSGGHWRSPPRTGGRVHSKNVRRQKLILHLCSSRKNFRGGRPFARAEILVGSGLGLGLGLGFRLGLWLRLGLRLGLGLEYHNPNPNPNPDPTIISAAEGHPRRKFLRGRNRGVREVFVGGHFSSELFRQFAAESARIRPYPRGVRRFPPNVRRTFGGVRRKIFLADVRRIRAEPGGVRAYPRGFARIRGGSSSAEPVRSICSNVLGFW